MYPFKDTCKYIIVACMVIFLHLYNDQKEIKMLQVFMFL